ncbi:Ubiquitin-associated (UBA) protein isoform 1 [Dorcoceras hygrometricum]|uniref:Ubiquitin-associated (UBA) protein isoform 1 n=1 Tax=Dorcoceras hygrometricum TaxID=472368 RepID=A0A2Z7AL94_9LAMI|nr:Ubiquitin-associated (UBA) protein isoform 1 [Dorcoceras hygrometricum]
MFLLSSFMCMCGLILIHRLLFFMADPSLNILTSGPYGLIFSSFVPFYFDIPVSTRFRVFSLNFSDKTFIYLAGLQLLLSSWKRSLLPGICGILAGSLYRSNVFHTRRMKLPDFVASFFSRLSWPSIGNTSPTVSPRNVLGSAPSAATRQMQATPAPTSSILEPPEDSIATLVSMGFERNSARQALVRTRNDINAATNILLDPHTS